jgi:hypothetical protein
VDMQIDFDPIVRLRRIDLIRTFTHARLSA